MELRAAKEGCLYPSFASSIRFNSAHQRSCEWNAPLRRRHWSTDQKLQIIEQSLQPGETVSSVARRRGVAPNLLYRWRRLMSEGGAAAVGSDEPVVGSSEVRRLEERIRDLERLLGRKTLEIEILREALAKSESKKPSLRLLSQPKDGSR